MNQIYRDYIIEQYKNPQNTGELEDPTHKEKLANYSCGDETTVSLVFEKEKVKDIKHHTVGCAICTASASITSEHIKNLTEDEIKKLNKKDILDLLKIEVTPSRLKCALLFLEAVKKALSNKNATG